MNNTIIQEKVKELVKLNDLYPRHAMSWGNSDADKWLHEQSRLILTSLVKEVREEEIATEWLLGDDTGSSSKAICRFMLGIEGEYPAPFDVADRGRCIRLLNSIPKWWNRLDEMASLPSIKVNVFSSKGMEIREDGWRQQIPLIKREAADLKSK